MSNWLLLGLIMVSTVHANDYLEGREAALNAQTNAVLNLGQINPNEYLNQYTEHPAESNIDPQSLAAAGRKKASADETAQQIIANEQAGDHVAINLNSEEMNQAGQAIDRAEDEINSKKIPCLDGACLPLSDEPGDDFGEGITQLGALGGAADEVSSKQVQANSPQLFSGTNAQCRQVVKPIGSCCDGKAHLMRCSKTEQLLAIARQEGRAVYVGTYCARSILRKCIKHKQSWCMFPSKLSSIIQIQGRGAQLNINFGYALRKTNAANCRGITPQELEQIDFQKLNLSSLTEEFKARTTKKNPVQMDAQTTQKVQRMEQEGRIYG